MLHSSPWVPSRFCKDMANFLSKYPSYLYMKSAYASRYRPSSILQFLLGSLQFWHYSSKYSWTNNTTLLITIESKNFHMHYRVLYCSYFGSKMLSLNSNFRYYNLSSYLSNQNWRFTKRNDFWTITRKGILK